MRPPAKPLASNDEVLRVLGRLGSVGVSHNRKTLKGRILSFATPPIVFKGQVHNMQILVVHSTRHTAVICALWGFCSIFAGHLSREVIHEAQYGTSFTDKLALITYGLHFRPPCTPGFL